MKRIYLDVCCLCRPFDDQSQDRIRLESEAVVLILRHIEKKRWKWIGSDVLRFEIDQIATERRRSRLELLVDFVQLTINLSDRVIQRAQELEILGFKSLDSLHVASAEEGKAEVLLTTDDRFLSNSKRNASKLHLRVENPLVWLEEMAGK